MSGVYDNWERLVGATLRREQRRRDALRSFSDLSLESSSSFNSRASSRRLSSFNLPNILVGVTFDYEMILRATKYLANSNLIKHGHTGDLFHGVLDDGTQVVVKKIELSSAEKELYCRSELETFGKAFHPRLVPLLGHCLENLGEKFLVYKYMPKRDLASVFRRKVLDWPTTLKIATGVAEALCYLHHQCTPPLVHSDVQASSILLDNDFEVRLGSLSKVCSQESESNGISRFRQFPQDFKQDSSGTVNPTCADDVYCFGNVLLELIRVKLRPRAAEVEADDNDPEASWEKHEDDVDRETWWKMKVIANYCLNGHPLMRLSMIDVIQALKRHWNGPWETVV